MNGVELTIRRRSTSGPWTIESPDGMQIYGESPTQRDALEAARDLVPSGLRCDVRIEGATTRVVGVIGRAETLAPAAPAGGDPPLTVEDAVVGVGAAAARLRGEGFDADGDGEADGDDALDGLLSRGPDSPSKSAFTAARAWIDVVIIVLSFLGAIVGVPLIAPWIQGGVVGVALSTLALSGGAFLAGVVFLSTRIDFEARAGATWAALILAGSFLASSLVATWLGQPAPDVQGPEFTRTIQRAFTIGGPPDVRIILAALAAVGFVLFGSAQVYGWGGALLSIACGLLIAWRAVDLWAGMKERAR